MPDVSVVAIVYNDAARLRTAVESALAQDIALEVVVVDDGSTDGTAQVIDELARDPRVRPLRLATNSGGCSLPRNTGLDAARGEWVTFLDSDDELEPGALAAMLAAASPEVDVVCGLVRRHYDDGTVHAWKPDLHTRHRRVTASELPRLLHDTIAPGKLYRRSRLVEYGVTFPLGVLFEDYRFSALAYAHARLVALIPEPVYRWNVSLDAEQASITRRLHDVESFADRLGGHRLAVDALRSEGFQDLADELDHKFVSHDLRLYLRHLHTRDRAYLERFRELALPFLDGLAPSVLARLGRTDVLAVHGLRADDFALVSLAARIHYRGHPRGAATPGARPAPALLRRPAIWLAAALAAARAGRG
ncbi:MAG: CDP-glycerol glycerophosphotransferase [Frankiaceae bacterium]|nr:CDP-glycerol glycerophosphotransferase [Frankiaceae bacterium]